MTAPTTRRLLSLTAVSALALCMTACGGDAEETASSTPSPTSSPSASADQEVSTVAVYEDFACPHCKDFHVGVGGFLTSVAQGGTAEVDYRIVDFLGQGDEESWSTRAANAFYCFRETTEDPNVQHDYQTELCSAAPAGLSDEQLIAQAEALDGDIADCVTQDGGSAQIQSALDGMSEDGVRGVPSVVVDGTVYDPQSDGDLMDWVLDQANLSRATS